MSKRKLRFAPLIRVSGEEQERKGESLRTQRAQIEQAVHTLGGMIPPKLAHKYSGQEHGTPGYERQKLDQLLKDAASGMLDAVIVADISRWSRDNEKSQTGLKVLRKNGIRFFVLTTEHDLNNPEAELVLGMFSHINQYLAKTQVKKSVDNRLARLRRGCPACGQVPFGRTFNKETETWGIDAEKQRFMQAVAKRYIAGDSLEQMSREFQVSTTSLWRTLVKQSGPEFLVAWNKLRLDDDDRKRVRHQLAKVEQLREANRRRAKRVHERVREIELDDLFIFIIDVPELLDAKTRAKIQSVAESRRKNRGPRKHEYLLKNYIYCGTCGKALTGQSQDKPKRSYRYYRHNASKRLSGSNCRQCLMYVDADAIEQAVLLHLFATLGNVTKIREAIEAANPKAQELAKVQQEIEDKTAELRRIDAKRQRFISAYGDGLLSKDQLADRVRSIEDSENVIRERMEGLTARLGSAPPPDVVKSAAARLAKRRAIIRGAMNSKELSRMTWKQKRELLDVFLAGKGPTGEPLGVFVNRDPGWTKQGRNNRRWQFQIRGRFTLEITDTAPLTERDRNLLKADADEGHAAANLKRIYSNLHLKAPPASPFRRTRTRLSCTISSGSSNSSSPGVTRLTSTPRATATRTSRPPLWARRWWSWSRTAGWS